jgi:hypothetical protein
MQPMGLKEAGYLTPTKALKNHGKNLRGNYGFCCGGGKALYPSA